MQGQRETQRQKRQRGSAEGRQLVCAIETGDKVFVGRAHAINFY